MDKIWKLIKGFVLVSSLVSLGMMWVNRGMIMSLAGVAGSGSMPVTADTSGLAKLIGAAAPDSAQAQMAAGALYLKQGLKDEAMASFQKASQADSGNADVHFKIGMIFSGENKPEEAEKEFREAIRLSPDHVDSRFGLAALLQKQNHLEEAAALYAEIQKIKPDSAEAHNNLGIVYDTLGRRKDALEEFVAAHQLAPNDDTIRLNLEETRAEVEIPVVQDAAEPAQPPEVGPTPEPEPEANDVLRLANGRSVRGRITEKTGEGVWVEFENGKMFFSREEILEINPKE